MYVDVRAAVQTEAESIDPDLTRFVDYSEVWKINMYLSETK